ncbi:RNA polymerase sigma factor SigC [Frankia sp. CNm7]|uniref:RNA polymerase sigma factor n=1 Tax=Frankia nepalensis TaxID=1836974 RepID=A0A937USV7_9ACTN|nr:RNA polymerase sigma factor SigC [Frankia nepalensis]MBL7498479.1 RNA polymerase sigma factor SigC [Frankia nepalensis]MBL7509500.1 RNA polymerase sigma factor SigC [Frankia nepalensis]MBL7518260.1 RNA polymerase sigma factor SigC [Frankia nepalensis]MBL7629311.1 RNA polymerase sigma factor SigC [Frankia nepalensis]
MATDDETVTAWALAAGRGDRQALESFVRATQRDVWRFVAYLAGPAAADDLAQETYLRALRSLRTFAAQSSARTWLLSIARHAVVDDVRSRMRRPRTTAAADWETAAERAQALAPPAAGFEDLVETNVMLAALDADRREALVLTQLIGLSYAEAAVVCGCPVGTIRSRVARARDDLMSWSRPGLDEGAGGI